MSAYSGPVCCLQKWRELSDIPCIFDASSQASDAVCLTSSGAAPYHGSVFNPATYDSDIPGAVGHVAEWDIEGAVAVESTKSADPVANACK